MLNWLMLSIVKVQSCFGVLHALSMPSCPTSQVNSAPLTASASSSIHAEVNMSCRKWPTTKVKWYTNWCSNAFFSNFSTAEALRDYFFIPLFSRWSLSLVGIFFSYLLVELYFELSPPSAKPVYREDFFFLEKTTPKRLGTWGENIILNKAYIF